MELRNCWKLIDDLVRDSALPWRDKNNHVLDVAKGTQSFETSLEEFCSWFEEPNQMKMPEIVKGLVALVDELQIISEGLQGEIDDKMEESEDDEPEEDEDLAEKRDTINDAIAEINSAIDSIKGTNW